MACGKAGDIRIDETEMGWRRRFVGFTSLELLNWT